MKGLRVAAALAALCGALGCHRLARPPLPQAAMIRSADAALAALERRESSTQTLTATFKLTVHRADGSEESSRGAVVVARPDRLRLQIFAFGVMTAYDYTANGDRYRARRPLDGAQVVGRFSERRASNDGDALGEDLRPLFLGAGALQGAAVGEADDRWIVSVDTPAGRREIEVAKRDGSVRRELLRGDGRERLAIEYADYRDVDGATMPFAVTVSVPEKRLRVTIEVAQYTRNQPVEPRLFDF
jgi:Domain of unknown function (DUF4292)